MTCMRADGLHAVDARKTVRCATDEYDAACARVCAAVGAVWFVARLLLQCRPHMRVCYALYAKYAPESLRARVYDDVDMHAVVDSAWMDTDARVGVSDRCARQVAMMMMVTACYSCVSASAAVCMSRICIRLVVQRQLVAYDGDGVR